jgi:hypothetical protein
MSLTDVVGKVGVEGDQPGGEDPVMGLGEQHCDLPAQRGEVVAVGVGDPFDQPLASEPAQVVGGLTGRVGASSSLETSTTSWRLENPR